MRLCLLDSPDPTDLDFYTPEPRTYTQFIRCWSFWKHNLAVIGAPAPVLTPSPFKSGRLATEARIASVTPAA